MILIDADGGRLDTSLPGSTGKAARLPWSPSPLDRLSLATASTRAGGGVIYTSGRVRISLPLPNGHEKDARTSTLKRETHQPTGDTWRHTRAGRVGAQSL